MRVGGRAKEKATHQNSMLHVGDRTHDLWLVRLMLLPAELMELCTKEAPDAGNEPAANGLKVQRSTELS